RLRPGDDRRARSGHPRRTRGRTTLIEEHAIEIDEAYLRHVVERLEGFRSHPLGFRVAGTLEEREATAFIAGELRESGLSAVVEETVPVDGWRLKDAFVELG